MSSKGWPKNIHKSILEFLKLNNFHQPSPVQNATLEPSLQGKNVVAEATTGSGKTLAYLIPLLSRLATCVKVDNARRLKIQAKIAHKAAGYSMSSSESEEEEEEEEEKDCGDKARFAVGGMIIVPTNDLSAQVYAVLEELLTYLRENSEDFSHIFGYYLDATESLEHLAQRIMHAKSTTKQYIIVSTPCRLRSLINEQCTLLTRFDINIREIKTVVLDEADQTLQNKTLSMPLHLILKNINRDRQMLIFSATVPKDFKMLSTVGAQDAVFVRVQVEGKVIPQAIATPPNLSNYVMELYDSQKILFLFRFVKHVIGRAKTQRKVLCFLPTTKVMNYIYRLFNLVILEHKMLDDVGKKKFSDKLLICRSAGKIDDNTRRLQLKKFNECEYGILFATDVAARGLDFKLQWVISYSFGTNIESMIHRGGRTARAGNTGSHLVLVTPQEKGLFVALFRQAGIIFNSLEDTPLFKEIDAKQKQAPLRLYEKAFDVDIVPPNVDDSVLREVFVAPGELNMLRDMERYQEMVKSNAFDEYEKPDPKIVEEEHSAWRAYMTSVAPNFVADSKQLMCLQRYLSSTRREFFLLAEEAGITYMTAYQSNEYKNTFKPETVPIGILMNSFGLIKLPRIDEIKGQIISDFVQYRPPSNDYLDIPYFDLGKNQEYTKKRESLQKSIDEARSVNQKRKRKLDMLNKKLDMGYLIPNKRRSDRRMMKIAKDLKEKEELKQMKTLLKKEHTGKLSKKEVQDIMGKGEEKTSKRNKIRI